MDDTEHGTPHRHVRRAEAQQGDGDERARDDTLREEGAAEAHRAEPNQLLRKLPLVDYEWLLPQLAAERLHLKQVLVEPNRSIRDIWFPRTGVCSMIAEEQAGDPMEVGTIGCDGFIGIPVVLGGDSMAYRVFVQIEGDGWRLGVEEFRRAIEERPVLRRLLLRFTQYFSDQLAQSVACNRLHTLEERCARWLLMTHDRVHGEAFELTHEFLSLMLGVRRAGVSVAMGVLQSAGIVRYTRGRVTILDRPRLEEASCDCYRITRAAQRRLIG